MGKKANLKPDAYSSACSTKPKRRLGHAFQVGTGLSWQHHGNISKPNPRGSYAFKVDWRSKREGLLRTRIAQHALPKRKLRHAFQVPARQSYQISSQLCRSGFRGLPEKPPPYIHITYPRPPVVWNVSPGTSTPPQLRKIIA